MPLPVADEGIVRFPQRSKNKDKIIRNFSGYRKAARSDNPEYDTDVRFKSSTQKYHPIRVVFY